MNKLLTAILMIMIALGLVATSCITEAPQVGKRAPGFQLNNLDGQSVVLSELRGKPVILNFWATWCGPCTYEMPFIQQVYDERPGDELVLLTINIAESPSKVEEFMQSYGLSFTVLLDSDGNTAQRYNIRGIPTTFFIDREGIIQEIKVGAFQSQAEIENSLSKLELPAKGG